MTKTYTAIPHEYLEEMDCLSDAEFGRLIRGLLQYSLCGEEPDLKGAEKMYWKRVRNQEQRQTESYQAYLTKQKENGKKGGRPKTQGFSEKTQKTHGFLEKPTQTQPNPKNPNININNNINNTKENTISDDIVQKKSTNFSFIPPTLEEIQDYCRERQSRVDPKAFFDYYSAGNWLDGRNQPVKNWKQKLITWEKHETGTRVETKPKRKSWAELGAELDAQRARERAYDGI